MEGRTPSLGLLDPDVQQADDEPFEALLEGRLLPEPPLVAWGALFDFMGGKAFCPMEAELATMWLVQQVPQALCALQHFSHLAKLCGSARLDCEANIETVAAVEISSGIESTADQVALLKLLGLSIFEARPLARRASTLARSLLERELDPDRKTRLLRAIEHLGMLQTTRLSKPPESVPEPEDVKRLTPDEVLQLPSEETLARLVVVANDESGDELLEALLALVGRSPEAREKLDSMVALCEKIGLRDEGPGALFSALEMKRQLGALEIAEAWERPEEILDPEGEIGIDRAPLSLLAKVELEGETDLDRVRRLESILKRLASAENT